VKPSPLSRSKRDEWKGKTANSYAYQGPEGSLTAAWYAAPIARFLDTSPDEVLGGIVRRSTFEITEKQRDAWGIEIAIARTALAGVPGWIFLEFDIPRLGSRVDAVVLTGSAIIPIEFKTGEHHYYPGDYNQAWDYALDLKNFHAASHGAPIFPILVAPDARTSDAAWGPPHQDGVRPPRRCNTESLARAIADARDQATGPELDGNAWGNATYRPTPTIIEAARALYSRHTVEAIARSDAGAINLAVTSRTVEQIIESAASERFKAIVFVTGVPGAGKTLVGLNIATQRRDEEAATHAVFLSGNGPLVAVLRAALTRDEKARLKRDAKRLRPGEVEQRVKQFIQNVHHFRDEGVRTMGSHEAPDDRVVIFDEAQRAWDLSRTAAFMKQRKGHAGFDRSEPQFLMEYMDRHPDWAVVICLVGGGQEINTGEAGISTWLHAVREHFPGWRAFISPELSDSEYAAGHALDALGGVARVERRPELHLAVSMRSFRSERVSAFVKALLDLEIDHARELLCEVRERYPIAVTRDLNAAKQWIRRQARGSERYGLVASSEAQRLKPHAVDVRVDINPVQWFLNDANDTRSSWYLEDAATEYQIQGLELDWVCVTWDADLRFSGGRWQHRSFKGKMWQQIRRPMRQQYLVNAYRVLLTRARQGMAIFVPPGDDTDRTRAPEFYDATYAYLREVGVPLIGSEGPAAKM
jgi:hypothetical protein